jgi:hypothetical protein
MSIDEEKLRGVFSFARFTINLVYIEEKKEC